MKKAIKSENKPIFANKLIKSIENWNKREIKSALP